MTHGMYVVVCSTEYNIQSTLGSVHNSSYMVFHMRCTVYRVQSVFDNLEYM